MYIMDETFIFFALLLSFLLIAYFARTFKQKDHEGEANTVDFIGLVATLLATAVGGGLIFGLIQFGKLSGITGVLLGVVYCLSFIFLGLLAPHIRAFCVYMREQGTIKEGENISLSLIFGRKYDRGTWSLIILAYGVIYSAFLAAQYVAITRIAQAMDVGVSENWLILISALTVLIYVSLGGYKAVLSSDKFQLTLITIMLITGVGALLFVGEVPSPSLLPDGYWNPVANEAVFSNFVWLSIFIFPSLLLRLDHWQRIVTADSDSTARSAYIVSGITLLFVFIVFLMIGASSQLAGSDDPFWLYSGGLSGLDESVRYLIYVIALAALLAAVVSSADTILNSISGFFSGTLSAWGLAKGANAWSAILVNIIVSASALLLAFYYKEVVKLITEGFKVMIILLPSIAAAIFLKKPSGFAARSSVISGLLTYILVVFVWASAQNWAYILGFLASLVTFSAIYYLEFRSSKIKPSQ